MDGERTMLTFHLSNNLVNVSLVVGYSVVCDAELPVGGQGSTVTIWQVVDNNLHQRFRTGGLAFRASIGKIGPEVCCFGDDIDPDEGSDIGNACGLRF